MELDFKTDWEMKYFEKFPNLVEPIAVIGIGGIFPDAENIAEFWSNLLNGHNSIREISHNVCSPWNLSAFYDPNPRSENKSYTKLGSFVPEIKFNPIDFQIPPKTAQQMDRSQKIALVAAREAFNDGGYSSKPFSRKETNVTLGVSNLEWQEKRLCSFTFDYILEHIKQSDIFSSLDTSVEILLSTKDQ
jgi:acyl transferase domain-containing protein